MAKQPPSQSYLEDQACRDEYLLPKKSSFLSYKTEPLVSVGSLTKSANLSTQKKPTTDIGKALEKVFVLEMAQGAVCFKKKTCNLTLEMC